MSKLLLFGPTALEFYEHCTTLPSEAVTFAAASRHSLVPHTATVGALQEQFPFLTEPLHFTVAEERDRRQRCAHCHVAPTSLREGLVVPITGDVFAPPPEIALIQGSRGFDLPRIALKGSALCGAFAITRDGHLTGREPLTSPGAVERLSRTHRDLAGCIAVRSAVPWMLPRGASPRELASALALALPTHHGGYGLLRPLLNQRVDVTRRGQPAAAKRYYVADLCWPAQRLILEYDSDAFHLTSSQHYYDAVKRTTLEEMGYRVITLTSRQLRSLDEMDKVAAIIAKALGRPLRIRTRNHRARQITLWKTLGLLR